MGAKPTPAVVVVLFGKRETVSTGGGGVILGERAITPGVTTLKTYIYSSSATSQPDDTDLTIKLTAGSL